MTFLQRLKAVRSLGPADYIFAFTLSVRLVALAHLTVSPFLLPTRGDMHFYNEWAQRILQGQFTDHLAFYGLPLYAYLLAFVYKLFGYSPFVPALCQAILEAGTATLIYKIATSVITNPRSQLVGVTAAVGWALFVPAQAYSVILMPTAWLIFVFWSLVWQIVRTEASPPPFRGLMLGSLTGFTAMGIATILFIIPLLLAAITLRPAPSAAKKAASTATLVLGLLLGIAPCWLHNALVARDPVILSAHSGINFWIGNNPKANGYPRIPPELRAGQAAMLQDSISEAEKAAGHSLKRSEVSAYWSQKARVYIREQFGDWLRLLGVKVVNFWNAFQYDDLSVITRLSEEGVIFPGIRFGLVAALSFPGLIFAWRKYPHSRWVAGAVLLHMISLLSVFVTERYRMAAVPGLLIFGAAGLSELWVSILKAKYGRAAIYLSLLVLSSCFVSMPKRDISLWALDSYNSGVQALESNQLEVAEKKLALAYAYVPGNAELNFALGNLSLAQQDKTAAKGFYLTTLRFNPKHEGSYNNLGVLALEEKQWDLAGTFFSKALDENPRDPKTHYLLARALLEGRRPQEALMEIERALDLKPEQAEFQELRAQILDAITASAP